MVSCGEARFHRRMLRAGFAFWRHCQAPSERNGLILIKWNTSMNNTHPLETALPVGLLLLIAGVCLLCHQAMTLRTLKRGRVRAGFSFRTLSFRSTYPAAIVIAIGIVLLGLGSFGTGY